MKFLASNISHLQHLPVFASKCASLGIQQQIAHSTLKLFKQKLLSDSLEFLKFEDAFAHLRAKQSLERVLIPAFFKFLRKNSPESAGMLTELMKYSDLSDPR